MFADSTLDFFCRGRDSGPGAFRLMSGLGAGAGRDERVPTPTSVDGGWQMCAVQMLLIVLPVLPNLTIVISYTYANL